MHQRSGAFFLIDLTCSAAEPPRPSPAYEQMFARAVAKVKDEGRYRVFMNIERKAGSYPEAVYHSEVCSCCCYVCCCWLLSSSLQHCTANALISCLPLPPLLQTGESKPVTVWCTNDYLGMSQHPVVVNGINNALKQIGAGYAVVFADCLFALAFIYLV